MTNVGTVVDKWVTSFVVEKHLPTGIEYVRFPFFEETEYQKKRYYPDDRILERYKLDYLRIPKPWIKGIE